MKKNLLKFLFIFLSLLFAGSIVSESALARKSLPGEMQGIQADVEPIGIAVLQIVLALGFVFGLALMVPPNTRRAGGALLTGVGGVALILYTFTNYMNSMAAPLTGIMTNTGRVSDLLNPSDGK